MLLYITMHPQGWSDNTYIAACSLSDQPMMQALEDNPNLKQLYICFDNDPPGEKAAQYLRAKLFAKGINSEFLIRSLKDWNEDL